MKSTTYLLTALTSLLAITTATPVPDNSQQCGSQWYDPSSYVCRTGSEGDTLCPIINGEPTQDCAGACYTPYRYEFVFLSSRTLIHGC
jgi:hypothetical protein